jgi:hypothetical protein
MNNPKILLAGHDSVVQNTELSLAFFIENRNY